MAEKNPLQADRLDEQMLNVVAVLSHLPNGFNSSYSDTIYMMMYVAYEMRDISHLCINTSGFGHFKKSIFVSTLDKPIGYVEA